MTLNAGSCTYWSIFSDARSLGGPDMAELTPSFGQKTLFACVVFTMDPTAHPLKTLLQIHLASDISAANHLPNVLVFLNEECFLPSPHLVKWTTRINSLLHSKDSYGRWAGLCLACQTSRYSKEIMIEYAQGWLSVAIPLLSVRVLA